MPSGYDLQRIEHGVVKGSLADVAKSQGTSVAEAFIGADLVVIFDASGSMAAADSRAGRTRYEVALEELAKIQERHPGKVAILAFSSSVVFVPGGSPPFLAQSTDLAGALEIAKTADVPGISFILVSDGEPDDQDRALRIARTFTAEIHVIYVGPESLPYGREFLYELAKATGGKRTTADRVQELASAVETLLIDSGESL